MAKKKAVTIKDILTKLDKAFKDVVIINHTFFCSTDNAESESIGYYFGLFSNDASSVLKESYPGFMVEIRSIKEAKASLGTSTEGDCIFEITREYDKDYYQEKFTSYFNHVAFMRDWKPLPFNDDELDRLLTNNEVVEGIFDGIEAPLQISKSLLPGVTVKSVRELTYFTDTDENFDYLFIHQPYDFFELYMMYTFMKG